MYSRYFLLGKLYNVDKMNRQQALRRYQNELVIIGGGVIAFGLWSALQTILIMFFGDKHILQEVEKIILRFPEYRWFFYALFLVALLLIIGLSISIRLFIGYKARKEGLHGVQSNLYLVLTAILVVINLTSIFLIMYRVMDGDKDYLNEMVQVIIDITNVVTLIQLIMAAKKSRQIQKELEQEAL